MIGDGAASVRYAVQDYPRNGTVYPVTGLNGSKWRWQVFDLSYWRGDDIHVELATNADQPLLAGGNPRSWFGVRDVRLIPKGHAEPKEVAEYLQTVFDIDDNPKSYIELVNQFSTAIDHAILAWQKDEATDAQALLLDQCIREGLLSNSISECKNARPLIDSYRKIENGIPIPRRVPGLDESKGTNHPLLVRGNHKTPGEPVARSFISAIDNAPYESNLSGRLSLAKDLMRDDNPLTRRVMVNRIWHHLFGRGIVSTPDNFGIMGDEPSHPDLLDWLALHFDKQQDWSLKQLVRTIVTSRTWQLSSTPSAQSIEIDPDNRLLSHANVRRMDAEVIRDQMLMLSGKLKNEAPKGSVKGDAPYRSLYVRVQRNDLDPFLRAFDFPEPFSAVGRRDSTNVPAQSLMLLNNPKISEYANDWAARIVAKPGSDHQRVNQMFIAAFGRQASNDEIDQAIVYTTGMRLLAQRQLNQLTSARLNIKEKQIAIDQLLDPVRKRLVNDQQSETQELADVKHQPIAKWEFADSANDLVDKLRGNLRNGAKIDGDALVVNGGYLVTEPIKHDLRAKTLEAWVQLDNLDQRAGGVMSVQTRDGRVFDAIVFAEQDPKKWMAGSDFFNRTQPFNGNTETDADKNPVHLAIVYHEDGRIEAFRNGEPYGKAYQSNGPADYKANETVVTFGLRHLPANPNKLLAGKIFKANLYDRALTVEQIADSAKSFSNYIPESRLLAELPEADRNKIARLKTQIQQLELATVELKNATSVNAELQPWSELARAMFIMKEFIYVR